MKTGGSGNVETGEATSAPLPDLQQLRTGGKRMLSRLLTRVETSSDDARISRFLDQACQEGTGHVLGLTGPPGVGKSTLTDALIRAFRQTGKSVAVLAIDPSSRVSGGALLGDRTRLQTNPDDPAVFVRSMAARDRLGGLSDHAIAAIALLRAVVDRVIVESVGIGQSEGDLVQACDTLVLCIQPGSGDSLQFMKAGIMELPDIVAVTKADVGAAARRASSDVSGAMSLSRFDQRDWEVPVCEISAQTGDGIAELVMAVENHRAFLAEGGRLDARRTSQHAHWLEDMIRSRFGTAGVAIAKKDFAGDFGPQAEAGPFSSYHHIAGVLNLRLSDV